MAEKKISLRHYNEMNEELKKLSDEREEIHQRLKKARSMGDLSSNPEYHEARKEWMLSEERILYLQAEIDRTEGIWDDFTGEN
ncbi:MAG TPA: hypothetical protein DCO72_01795 [Ruminococcus sp.]|nr:hypothetical protein [Ruminococcus sp.]